MKILTTFQTIFKISSCNVIYEYETVYLGQTLGKRKIEKGKIVKNVDRF